MKNTKQKMFSLVKKELNAKNVGSFLLPFFGHQLPLWSKHSNTIQKIGTQQVREVAKNNFFEICEKTVDITFAK